MFAKIISTVKKSLKWVALAAAAIGSAFVVAKAYAHVTAVPVDAIVESAIDSEAEGGAGNEAAVVDATTPAVTNNNTNPSTEGNSPASEVAGADSVDGSTGKPAADNA